MIRHVFNNHLPDLRSLVVLLPALLMAGFGCRALASTGDVWREATLYRDEWGTPHVYGENPFALAFVFGYAQAEDHAEHILLAYRMANGRLSAVLGEAYADSDAFSLKMGHERLAREALARADPFTAALCEGFAMGVNSWLVEHAERMPAWADGVQPHDPLALWHAFVMSLAPFDLPDLYFRQPEITTGNAWAMAPGRGEGGKAILVVNPHQRHDGFFQWYEAHLVMGDMNMYGATLRGLPLIVQGHNETLGWALTPNRANFADMYTESFERPERNPKDPRLSPDDSLERQALLLYYMSQSQPYHVRTDGGLETRYVPAYIGSRGPIFDHGFLGLHSWLIGGYRDFGGFLQLFEMARARNLTAFWAALHLQQIPCFHVVYADREGNIAYLYNAKAGTRIAPGPDAEGNVSQEQWNGPLSANLAFHAWQSVYTPSTLPHCVNPSSGYVQACGNPPWTASEDAALDPSLWPSWLANDRDSYRGMRVRQLLRRGQRSFRDHQSMLFDVVVPAAFDMVPAILHAADTRSELSRTVHPDFWAGIALLRGWNCIAEVGAPGMTFYHLWWTVARNRAARRYPDETAFYQAAIQGAPPAQEIMIRAVEDAARTMRNEYGHIEVPWGDVHRIRRGDREAPMPGASSGEPIFLASDTVFERGRWVATYGYGFAMVTQFGEEPESVSMLPFGASQNPDSPHFDDQLDLMLERRFKRVRFAHGDILRRAERAMGKRITLMPQGVSGMVTLHGQGILHGRLNVRNDAPDPLPREMIPFCLYIQPERRPAGTPVQVELSIHIPSVLCDDHGFLSLQIYRKEPGLPWEPLPLQQRNPAQRVIVGQDPVLAETYVVLGPAEVAGVDRYAAMPDAVEAPAAAGNLVGLDALLSGHTVNPALTGRAPRFHIERLDQVQDAPPALLTRDIPDERPEGTFHIQRHDDARTGLPSIAPEVQGFRFGPGIGTQDSPDRDAADEKSDEADRLATETDSVVDAPDVSISPPPSGATPSLPLPVETETPDPEIADGPPQSATPPPVDKPRERPPLPDIIPQDPAFVFGGGDRRTGTTPAPSNEERIFRIQQEAP